MGVHLGDKAENASECSRPISHLQFQNFPGDDTRTLVAGGATPSRTLPQHGAGLLRRCCDPHVTTVLGAYILRASSVSETFRCPCVTLITAVSTIFHNKGRSCA